MRQIIAAVHDLGGANVIKPVIAGLLENAACDVILYTSDFTFQHMIGLGLTPRRLNTSLTLGEAARILSSHKADLLLTGTSFNSNAEQMLRNVAAERRIPSIVVLDFWANFRVRWGDATYDLADMSDLVFVMDEYCRKEMIADGFRPDALIVSGHPYLEQMFNKTDFDSSHSPAAGLRVLYLSQPFEIIKPRIGSVHPVEVLGEVLERYRQVHDKPVSLTVKLHPKEKKETALVDIIANLNGHGLDIRVSDRFMPAGEVIESHDCVFGFTSIALFEARARQKPVFSFDVCGRLPSLQAAMETVGIRNVSLDAEVLYRCLLQNDNDKPLSMFSGATRIIIQEIEKILERVEAHP